MRMAEKLPAWVGGHRGREGVELFEVVRERVVHEAGVHAGGSGVDEPAQQGAGSLAIARGVDGSVGLEQYVDRRSATPTRPSRECWSIAAISSSVRPNGAQPSASSTARRNDRAVRPPIHNGTRGCTPQGSTTRPEYSK